MDSPSLDGARAKLAWAKLRYDELEARIATAAPQFAAIGFGQEFHADTSTIKVTLQGVPELPIEWALLAADFLQNLRCALNYLAWELSRWNLRQQGLTRDPSPQTQCPITVKPREFDAGRLPDAHQDHVARIQALQPNAPDGLMIFPEGMLRTITPDNLAQALGNVHPLGQLAQLTNEDKHRVLPSVVTNAVESHVGTYVGIDCRIDHINHLMQLSLENDVVWTELKITPTGADPKVQIGDRIVTDVSFGVASKRRDLPMIGQTVTEIVREFEPIF